MCQTDECLNDSNDCNMDTMCTDDYCAKIYGYWSFVIDGADKVYAGNHTVVCYDWLPKFGKFFDIEYMESLASIFQLDVFRNAEDCLELARIVDFNEDGYINFREMTAITSLAVGDFDLDKAIGLNCSACVGTDAYNIDYNYL